MNDRSEKQYFDVKFDFPQNKYEPIKSIGNGAYGVVCLALHKKTGQNVAIKKITNAFDHFVIGMRTYREIKILRHVVNHENIISIRDVFLGQDNLKDVYIVFDFMDTDLKRVLESTQILTNDHIKYFSYQILNGLAFIHQTGIIHRDIKPSNILVSENCNLKIADFGMARQYRDHDQTQYVVTRWYRAPEVILGYTEYSQAIDLWSFGCILAEMFGRRPIFSGTNTITQLQLIFIILGTPSKSYLSSLNSGCFRRIISSVGNRPVTDFNALYPNATNEGVDLLRKLLIIEPEQRISAQQALSHSFVSEFNITNDDENDSNMEQDIVKFDSGFESEKWTLEQLQKAIHNEIQGYQLRPMITSANQSLTLNARVIIIDSTPPVVEQENKRKDRSVDSDQNSKRLLTNGSES